MTNAHEAESTYATQTHFFSFLYDDARDAIAWLERAFGAMKFVAYDGPDGKIVHAEMHLAGNTFMLGTRAPDKTAADGCYIVLPDAAAIDAMHARAAAAGAEIVRAPYDTEYGSHDLSLKDCGGNAWQFGTYRPGVPGPAHAAHAT